jgi:hypothetical protein
VLDENRSLIFAVLENQNMQRLAECSRYHQRTAPRLPTRVSCVACVSCACVVCAHGGALSFLTLWSYVAQYTRRYQARLQQNLIFLATVADAQPGLRKRSPSDGAGEGPASLMGPSSSSSSAPAPSPAAQSAHGYMRSSGGPSSTGSLSCRVCGLLCRVSCVSCVSCRVCGVCGSFFLSGECQACQRRTTRAIRRTRRRTAARCCRPRRRRPTGQRPMRRRRSRSPRRTRACRRRRQLAPTHLHSSSRPTRSRRPCHRRRRGRRPRLASTTPCPPPPLCRLR